MARAKEIYESTQAIHSSQFEKILQTSAIHEKTTDEIDCDAEVIECRGVGGWHKTGVAVIQKAKRQSLVHKR